MLCVWWDIEGVLYWELLDSKTTLTAAVYTQQLDRLATAIAEKRPKLQKVILHHDNARPHTAKLTRSKIKELNWELLAQPVYSPDLAPSDYYLFRAMSNELADQHFDKDEDVKNWLTNFFNSKPRVFYERGIRQLPIKWAQVVHSNGQYLE